MSADAILELWEFDGAFDQEWIITYLHNGYYTIISDASGKALTAPTSVNASVTQTTYTGATNQQWKFTDVGNGMHRISPRSNESYYLAAGDGVFTTDGRNIEIRNSQSDNKDEWFMCAISSTGSMLLGITYSGHDHHTVYGVIMPDLKQLGYGSYNCIITNAITRANAQNAMRSCRVFVERSHGQTDANGSYFHLNTSSSVWIHSLDIYNYTSNTPVVDLSNCDLMLFVSCLSGAHETRSLPHAAVAAGAEAAVGFKEQIYCNYANLWTKYFFDRYLDGYSVSLSAQYAAQSCNNLGNISSYRVITR